jgi:hypothetical protein
MSLSLSYLEPVKDLTLIGGGTQIAQPLAPLPRPDKRYDEGAFVAPYPILVLEETNRRHCALRQASPGPRPPCARAHSGA